MEVKMKKRGVIGRNMKFGRKVRGEIENICVGIIIGIVLVEGIIILMKIMMMMVGLRYFIGEDVVMIVNLILL